MEIDVDVSPKRRRDDEPPEKIALLFWEGVINLSGGVHKLKSEGANGEHTTIPIPSTAVTTAAAVKYYHGTITDREDWKRRHKKECEFKKFKK
jgi:hypothetical protein